jgi:hypothetical protein
MRSESGSLETAANAVRAFVKVIDVAQDMRTALATGIVLDEVLLEAERLLAVVERELEALDRVRHPTLFAALPRLRRKLERFGHELCGRPVD